MNTSQQLDALAGMFEAWDRETLGAVLQSNGGNLEHSIEAILAMEQPHHAAASSPSSATPSTTSPPQPPTTAA